MTQLKRAPLLPIGQIELVDKRSMLPPIWRRLFLSLEEANVSIVEKPHQVSLSDNDQGQLVNYLSGADYRPLSGDGSFSIVESDDEIQAAEFLAGLLGHELSSGSSDTVIIRGGNTSFLDRTLQKQNLPRLGAGLVSSQRSILQLLPLTFATCWKPFDPFRLIEFLMLPQSPLPPYVASTFMESLRTQPGREGPAWQKAWATVLEKSTTKDSIESSTDLALVAADRAAIEVAAAEVVVAAARQRQEWAQWLQPELFQANLGMPSSAAIDICHRVRNHALTLSAQYKDEVYARAATDAENAAQAIELQGQKSLPRRQLEHILSAVLAEGYRADKAEEAPWVLVDHPGQICAPAGNVFWWLFVADEGLPRPHIWTRAELAELSEHDVHLESAIAATAREAISWRRPLTAPCRKLCLIKPRTLAGTYVAPHPFNHELSGLLQETDADASNRFIVQAHRLYKEEKMEFGDRILARTPIKNKTIPGERGVWQIGAGIIIDKSESPSSLERLIECPLSWLLQSRAFLRRGNLLSVVSAELLAGNLAHAVFAEMFSTQMFSAEIFTAELSSTIDDIATKTEQTFDRLCPQYAAPLLMPGKSLQRSNLRKAVTEGVVHLATLVKQAGFSTINCENQLTLLYDGVELSGRSDLHLTHPKGCDYVIDLKWTRFSTRRKQELEAGHALQLAIYSSLCQNSNGRPTEAGYYVLAQKELLTSSPGPFPPYTYVEGPALSDTFDKIIAAYHKHMKHLHAGTVYATGISTPDADNTPAAVTRSAGGKPISWTPVPDVQLTKEPPCKFCHYSRICGTRRVGSS